MFFLSFKKIGSKRGQKIRVVADTTRGQSRASVVHSVKEQHRRSLEATERNKQAILVLKKK